MAKGFSPVILILWIASLGLGGCAPGNQMALLPTATGASSASSVQEANDLQPSSLNFQPSYPSRPLYEPGELVDYTAQTGDTLPNLAAHFNTTVEEILRANTFIPDSATTMPPGMPMRIPIYYLPFWGNPYQILPDSLFINGPAQVGFDLEEMVSQSNGWLKDYTSYVSGDTRSGAEIIERVAMNYSLSPRLLLALLEYASGALTLSPEQAAERLPDYQVYPLGYVNRKYRGLYMQLVWAANTLNNGYYGWRTGALKTLELRNGRIEHPDPWQNAASVALQYFYSLLLPAEDTGADTPTYPVAVAENGLAATYRALFGDPWSGAEAHIPGSLAQPEFALPFQLRRVWAFTGGPHTGWGEGEPYSALDFAPPAVVGGCTPTEEWATAVAPGVVVRSEPAIVVLDLDGDGDERTGWVVFYLHVGNEGRAPVGAVLNTGDPIGHPSCEGGRATGTHIHIARKYNGEWIPAEGPLAFNLEGWIAHNGPQPYQGTLTRYGNTVTACECSDHRSHIESGLVANEARQP